MIVQVNAIQLNSEHVFGRSETLRLGRREFSAQALRAALQPQSAHPANNRSIPSATPLPEPLTFANPDATTRLRALVLSAMLGRDPLPAPVESVPAGPGEKPIAHVTAKFAESSADASTEAAMLAGEATLLVREQEHSDVLLTASLRVGGRTVTGTLRVGQSRVSVQALQADAAMVVKFLDPLVLNFAGPVVLSRSGVGFDLDADGRVESLPQISSDSYFLAWDQNHNGTIDNGTEVIGAISGDGYADLRAMDEDGDGFLTAGDSGFDYLRLWRPGQAGAGESLAARSVEAIYLTGVPSPFSLYDSQGQAQLAQVRQSSFFVAAGQLRLSQQIDLVV